MAVTNEEAMSRVTGEPMRCPSCGSRLVEVERAAVLIDACPSCRGVWLDRGELDKILVEERRLTAGDPDEDFLREVEGRGRGSSSEQQTHREDPRDYQKKRKRKRGFLEDLLDFG
jgi:Zn-finger nucleic acid-binding protein